MHDISASAATDVSENENENENERSETDEVPNPKRAPARGRAGLRAALIFGVVAATVELGLILWMGVC